MQTPTFPWKCLASELTNTTTRWHRILPKVKHAKLTFKKAIEFQMNDMIVSIENPIPTH